MDFATANAVRSGPPQFPSLGYDFGSKYHTMYLGLVADSEVLVPQEAAPSRGGSLGTPREVPADSSLAHVDAEFEQFAVDARHAPERIGAAHLTDQGPDFGLGDAV
jgi:hypothetical protein